MRDELMQANEDIYWGQDRETIEKLRNRVIDLNDIPTKPDPPLTSTVPLEGTMYSMAKNNNIDIHEMLRLNPQYNPKDMAREGDPINTPYTDPRSELAITEEWMGEQRPTASAEYRERALALETGEVISRAEYRERALALHAPSSTVELETEEEDNKSFWDHVLGWGAVSTIVGGTGTTAYLMDKKHRKWINENKKVLGDAETSKIQTEISDAIQEDVINRGVADPETEARLRDIEKKYGIKPPSDSDFLTEGEILDQLMDEGIEGYKKAVEYEKPKFNIDPSAKVNDSWVQKQIVDAIELDVARLNSVWSEYPDSDFVRGELKAEAGRPDATHIQEQITTAIEQHIIEEQKFFDDFAKKNIEWEIEKRRRIRRDPKMKDRLAEMRAANEKNIKEIGKKIAEMKEILSLLETQQTDPRIIQERIRRIYKPVTKSLRKTRVPAAVIGAGEAVKLSAKNLLSPKLNAEALKNIRTVTNTRGGKAGGAIFFLYSMIGVLRSLEEGDTKDLTEGWQGPWFKEWIKDVGIMQMGGPEAWENMTINNLVYYITSIYKPKEQLRILSEIPKSLKDVFVEPLIWIMEKLDQGSDTSSVTPMNSRSGQSTPQGQYPPSVQQ